MAQTQAQRFLVFLYQNLLFPLRSSPPPPASSSIFFPITHCFWLHTASCCCLLPTASSLHICSHWQRLQGWSSGSIPSWTRSGQQNLISRALSPFSSLLHKRTNINTARHFFLVCHFKSLMCKELLAEWVTSKDTDISSDLCNIELIHCREVKITTLFLLIFLLWEQNTFGNGCCGTCWNKTQRRNKPTLPYDWTFSFALHTLIWNVLKPLMIVISSQGR